MRNLYNTFILLNGPPGSGKDTIADEICARTGADKLMFKDALYEDTAKAFDMPLEHFKELAINRDTKEYPNTKLPWDRFAALGTDMRKQFGSTLNTRFLSPRQALIVVSEMITKPKHGNSYYGKKSAEKLDRAVGAVFSDSGFMAEAEAIMEQIGPRNVFVARLHRKGCTFEGDSRDYIHLPYPATTFDVDNDWTVESAVDFILKTIHNERMFQAETFW